MKQPKLTKASRTKLSKYAFFLGSAVTLIGRAGAQTVADFTFENSYSTGTATNTAGSTVAATSGMLLAEVGLGTAIGVHAAAGTNYTFPAGNGSLKSFSGNDYAANDYFQFEINASGYTALAVSFDSIASGTGPKAFTLEYSTDGSTFSNFTTYTLDTGVSTFSTGSTNTAANYAFNLSGISALNGVTDYFRLVDTDTTTATAGTARVDNFLVTGTVAAAPEPSSIALLSIAGAGVVMAARRRKRA